MGGIYRIKTAAANQLDLSDYSEELIVALARLPSTPVAPTFDLVLSNKFQNVLVWTAGESIDIRVTGY